MNEGIVIVPFQRELAPAFGALNLEWIERLFVVEEADRKVLFDPETAIVQPGGQVFFALDGAHPVGTVAVVREPDGVYELSKMAVAASHRRRGLGERLGRAAIGYAREVRAAKLCLWTNSSLTGAIRLYQRLGFVHREVPAQTGYARADVYMELEPSRLAAVAADVNGEYT